MNNNRNLYERIKSACKEKGVPITTLEKDLRFPQSSIRKWKKNEPGIWKVKKVADYLGTSIDKLISQQ